MELVGDRQHLIQKINEQLDDLGLKALERTTRVQIEKPKTIRRGPDLAPLIEHTLLRPEARREDIVKLCNEAKRFRFWGVCVNPIFVEEARKQLIGTDCLVIVTVGFPLGANLTVTKVEETQHVIKLGANEVDMVIALGALKDGNYEEVYKDIHDVVVASRSVPVKVILENYFLNETEKVAACLITMRAGASFVKTSTGFAPEGAKVEDVSLMREVVGDRLGVKAAGKIRNFETAREMIEAGASRLGCSGSVAIVTKS